MYNSKQLEGVMFISLYDICVYVCICECTIISTKIDFYIELQSSKYATYLSSAATKHCLATGMSCEIELYFICFYFMTRHKGIQFEMIRNLC